MKSDVSVHRAWRSKGLFCLCWIRGARCWGRAQVPGRTRGWGCGSGCWENGAGERLVPALLDEVCDEPKPSLTERPVRAGSRFWPCSLLSSPTVLPPPTPRAFTGKQCETMPFCAQADKTAVSFPTAVEGTLPALPGWWRDADLSGKLIWEQRRGSAFSCYHRWQRGTTAFCSAWPSLLLPRVPALSTGPPPAPSMGPRPARREKRWWGRLFPPPPLPTAGSTARGREYHVENLIDSGLAEAEESIRFLPLEPRLLQPFTGKPVGKGVAAEPVPAPLGPCGGQKDWAIGPPATSAQGKALPLGRPRPSLPALEHAASHRLQSDRQVSENQVVLFNA